MSKTNSTIKKFIRDYFFSKEEESTPKTIVIREGAAPRLLDEVQPAKTILEGVISSPRNFYEKRKELHDPNKCHVTFDRTLGVINLIVDEQYHETNYTIKGKIQENPDLRLFHINTNKMFGIKELMSLLKFNRIHFVDKEANAKIVLSLQNFKAKIEKALVDSSDNRGMDEKSKLTKLEHELEESFKLHMPIFKGGEPFTFVVDICLSASSSDVHVWLESKELKELIDKLKEQTITKELETFKDIVCIEQ